MATKKNSTISEEEFVLKAIKAGASDKSKGIHSVYSGFNSAFRTVYPGSDPVVVTTRMAKADKIVVQMRRGGAMLYLPGEAPAAVDKGAKLLAVRGMAS